MADPWPATLPQSPLMGAGRAPIDGVLRVQPDTGPPISRRRYTAVPIALPEWRTTLDGTQYQTLMTFHDVTLQGGALPFEWLDKLADTTVDMRFLSPPSARCVRPSNVAADRLWNVTLELVIDP